MKDNWKLLYDARTMTVDSMLKGVLSYRHIFNSNEFLHPTSSNLIPYERFHNIEKAYEIIKSTIDANGNFLIYGDVDTDGCTAAAIVYRYLYNFNKNLTVHINEGKVHGITEEFISSNKARDTIIIVDSINSTVDAYKALLDKGYKLIIMDHHVPSDAVLKIQDDICLISSAIDNYENPTLSGAGVVWKVMKYLDIRFGTTYADDLVDLATVGIIADMSEVGPNAMENRYICNLGLNHIVNPAIKAIVGKYEFTSKTISYSIAPLVNGANRLENNDIALKLFMIDDITQINDTVASLDKYRDYQRSKVSEVFETKIKPQAELQSGNKCLYFEIDGDRNFTGLIANKCVGEYKKPTFVLNKNETTGNYEGSMRALDVKDFRAIINETNIGNAYGHESAAGVIIPIDKYELFKEEMENSLKDIEFKDTLIVDLQINPTQINNYLIQQLKEVNKITGNGFKEVLVLISDISKYSIGSMSDKLHMKVTSSGMTYIMWRIPSWDNVYESATFSAVGTLDNSNWKKEPQMILTDYVFENPTVSNSIGDLWA